MDRNSRWLNELVAAKNKLEARAAFEKSKRWLNRQHLVDPFNKSRRDKDDFYHTTFQVLKNYPTKFQALMRMHPTTFRVLLQLVEKHIGPKRKTGTAILAEQRLFITLMYLAHGSQIIVLALTNKMAKATVYKIINHTCEGIYKALSPDYLQFPSTPTWRNIGKKFGERWQLPGCLSAVDGKHIHIKAPDQSGSLFFNYKRRFSIVLMAAVNHDYEFTWVSIGHYGGESDGGILKRTKFGSYLETNTLNTPKELITLPGSSSKINHFFIGDDAFALRKNFMKPFHGKNLNEKEKVFNYRISRARRCVESAFGILAMRWRLLDRTIGLNPNSIDRIVKAMVCLHNFLSSMDDVPPDVENYKHAQNHKETEDLIKNTGNHDTGDASAVRTLLMEYFSSPAGQVPWQLERVRRGLKKNT